MLKLKKTTSTDVDLVIKTHSVGLHSGGIQSGACNLGAYCWEPTIIRSMDFRFGDPNTRSFKKCIYIYIYINKKRRQKAVPGTLVR